MAFSSWYLSTYLWRLLCCPLLWFACCLFELLLLAQIERDKAAEQARLKRQKIIDQYGADYVVDKSCYEANGWFWGNGGSETFYGCPATGEYYVWVRPSSESGNCSFPNP